jgi:hypothetical protein
MQGLWSWLLGNGGILMSGISGIFSVFSNNKKGKLWEILPILGVIVGMVWALASAGFADRQQRDKMERAITRVDDYVTAQSAKSVNLIDINTRIAMQQYFGTLPSVARAASSEHVLEIVKAATSANDIIRNLPQTRRDQLTIRVFNHVQREVDYTVVKTRLQQMAASIVLLPPKQNETPTNSVWWSDGASLEEAKAAALIVTSAGLQIRQICPAQIVRTKDLIQIGGSIGIENLPVLSIPQLQGLTSPVCP